VEKSQMTGKIKMSDKFFIYQPEGEGCGDFVAFNGAYGESILDEAECVKMLNGFNNTCAKQAEQIKMLREALSNLASISHENEEKLADRMYKDFKESDELLMAYKALSATEQK
jgi:uncharacterized protein YcgI (DUF1989 family)